MATVLIPIIFRGPTHGEASATVSAETIGASLDAVEARFPGVRELVIDPKTGGIHRFVKLTLNGELLDRNPDVLERPVRESDEIEVIAAIAGG
jgi:molybdopterin converting factor small subunit